MDALTVDLEQLTPPERRDLANALLRAAWSAVLDETRRLLLDLSVAADPAPERRAPVTDADVRAVAEAVVQVLLERGLLPAPASRADDRVLTAADVAVLLGRSRHWVYAHAEDLGAFRYGAGPRARLGFDRIEIERWKQGHAVRSKAPATRGARRRSVRAGPSASVELIPFEPVHERRRIAGSGDG